MDSNIYVVKSDNWKGFNGVLVYAENKNWTGIYLHCKVLEDICINY